MWPLYLVLLFLVELHGSVGLYRLAVKWGGFADGDARPAQAQAPEMGLHRVLPGPGSVDLGRLHETGHRARRPGRRTLCAGCDEGRSMNLIYTDALVIGGGLAGQRTAVGIKRRGLEPLILSLVPAKRSHSVAAQGGMQASLANCIKGEGDNEDIHFEDTVRGSDWGCDQTGRPHVRPHGAQGGAGAGGLGRGLEPGEAWRPPGGHQRPARHPHGKGRRPRPHHRPRFRRHARNGAPATPPTAPATPCCTRCPTGSSAESIPVRERVEALALIHDGHRCHGAVVRDLVTGELTALSGESHGHRHRRLRPHLGRQHQRPHQRGHGCRPGPGNRRGAPGQHGSGAVPPHRHRARRHPGHRRLPRRRRPAQGRGRLPLHARLRAGQEGTRLPRRGVAAHGRAHAQGQGRASHPTASISGSTSPVWAPPTSTRTCGK